MPSLEELRALHDERWREGEQTLHRLQFLHAEVLRLRKEIEALDPDDYDPVHLLFNGTFASHDE